jgi:hypothetical protein
MKKSNRLIPIRELFPDLPNGTVAFDVIDGPWIPFSKGSHKQAGEICIIRKDNEHGMESYGWHNIRNKIIIYSAGHNERLPKVIWDRLLKVAAEGAKTLNKETA